ncbi:hypothetical protein [Streptomyces yerevanensis]|nr:hypothetical protein [Streptomyces yerevanensis]
MPTRTVRAVRAVRAAVLPASAGPQLLIPWRGATRRMLPLNFSGSRSGI